MKTNCSAFFLLMLSVFFANTAIAAPSWTSGNLIDITSYAGGLLIRTDSPLPDNCVGVPFGWMLIPETNRTMVATTLAMWMGGNKSVTIYTNATTGTYCIINQVDPAN